MSPLEFMQRLAALVPRPRLHLIRFHGVLAPNAKLRREIVPSPPEQATALACDHAQGAPARLSWARRLKRVFDIDIEHCPNCGGSLKSIAAIEDPPVIVKILAYLGLHAPHAPLRSDSIYSRQSEEPKTGCQREPTAPLALSSSERRHKAPLAHLPPALRPSRPKQHRDFHQTERRLTSHRSGDTTRSRKKGGLKFLYQLITLLESCLRGSFYATMHTAQCEFRHIAADRKLFGIRGS
jgi:hypothetical protein